MYFVNSHLWWEGINTRFSDIFRSSSICTSAHIHGWPISIYIINKFNILGLGQLCLGEKKEYQTPFEKGKNVTLKWFTYDTLTCKSHLYNTLNIHLNCSQSCKSFTKSKNGVIQFMIVSNNSPVFIQSTNLLFTNHCMCTFYCFNCLGFIL